MMMTTSIRVSWYRPSLAHFMVMGLPPESGRYHCFDLKMPIFAHGHSTQVKKPNHHHAYYEAKTGKNLAFLYDACSSMMPCGFQKTWLLVQPHFGWTVKYDVKSKKVESASKEGSDEVVLICLLTQQLCTNARSETIPNP